MKLTLYRRAKHGARRGRGLEGRGKLHLCFASVPELKNNTWLILHTASTESDWLTDWGSVSLHWPEESPGGPLGHLAVTGRPGAGQDQGGGAGLLLLQQSPMTWLETQVTWPPVQCYSPELHTLIYPFWHQHANTVQDTDYGWYIISVLEYHIKRYINFIYYYYYYINIANP